ncbi:MAG: flagellar biosynthetic protein FliO [Chloroflexi bacterium]|nr:flagellar biosynthetic protein FliO [Chloroflexota bacterium]
MPWLSLFTSEKSKKSFVFPILLIAAMGIGLYAMSMLSSGLTPSLGQEQATTTATATPTADQQGYLIQDYDSLQSPVTQPPNNWWSDGIDVFVKLVVVLGVVYLALRGLRYLNNKSRASTNASSPVKVLYSTSLAQHQNLYLVEVANKVLVLGGTSNNLALLAEVDDPAAVLSLQSGPTLNPTGSAFSSYLDRLLKSSKPVAVPTEPQPAGGSLAQVMEDFRQNLSKTRSELQQMAQERAQ